MGPPEWSSEAGRWGAAARDEFARSIHTAALATCHRHHPRSPLVARRTPGLRSRLPTSTRGAGGRPKRQHGGGEQVISNAIFHYGAPIAAVLGWLTVGPRPRINRRVVAASLLWPSLWFAYTLARGRLSHWYPSIPRRRHPRVRARHRSRPARAARPRRRVGHLAAWRQATATRAMTRLGDPDGRRL
jgi:hypothetical protein